jgi:acetyl-CoA carboxylase carboxyl transferase subunit beta
LPPTYGGDPLAYVGEVPYPKQLAQTRAATGSPESVAAARTQIGGRDCVVVAFDFGFLGGSLGVAAGQVIVEALEIAADERRPVVMIVASSGARMQEGLAALFQMARTAAAVVRLRTARVPLVTVLTHPTTGAPFASCANLADILLAEPGALIGFAGPRVVAQVTGRLREARRAEDLAHAGLVDAVVPRQALRRELALAIDLLQPLGQSAAAPLPELPVPVAPEDRWDLLRRLRDPHAPTAAQWLALLAGRRVYLRGDRGGADDPAMVCAVAEVAGRSMVVLAHDRLAGSGYVTAAGYRKAMRALAIASRLELPVLSLIDTPGAAVGPEADGEGVAHWIAECFATMLTLPVPIVSLVVGQGSSGGALALAVGDRLYMLEESTFSVIAPEGAAAILPKAGLPPQEWAEKLKLAAADAFDLGLIDGVVPGGGTDRRTRNATVRRVLDLLAGVLPELEAREPADVVMARVARYRGAGEHLLASA